MTKRKPLNRGKQKEKSAPARPSNRDGDQRRNPRQSGRPEAPSRGPSGARSSASRGKQPRSSHEGNNANYNSDWLYGIHAVHEAVKNPRRTLHRLVATSKTAEALPVGTPARIAIDLATYDEITEMLPGSAVHQGLALHAAPLPDLALEDVLAPYEEACAAPLVFLDQVTDPHNVGAILRSAAAFGAAAVIVQDRHAPQITGTLAKSASGALEHMPVIRVTNLSRSLEAVASAGYFRLGLAGEAEADLGAAPLPDKIALVLGAEGPGLRRLTREKCDLLVKLPTNEPISSLNVSNAAAVALFAIRQGGRSACADPENNRLNKHSR